VLERFDRCDQRSRRLLRDTGWIIRIDPTRQFEQIGALGPRQLQRLGHPAKRVGRGLNRSALLDPGAPSHADPGERRKLFAAQSWRAPPAARRRRSDALAMGADEFAEKATLIGFQHG
jgi:hypothetical protein